MLSDSNLTHGPDIEEPVSERNMGVTLFIGVYYKMIQENYDETTWNERDRDST